MREHDQPPTGNIRAIPNPVTPEHGAEHASVTLAWTASGVEQVEIRVGAPDGSLFVSGSAVGSETTGEWVADWMTFFLQDVTDGRPLTAAHTLSTACVRVAHGSARRRLEEHRNSERQRLERLPAFEAATTTLFGAPFRIIDAPSFLTMYHEIVELGIYAFDTSRDKPYVIDCGANVGVSVWFFKNRYPGARVVAFEPNDWAFEALTQNAAAMGWTDVTLVNKAVAAHDGAVRFVKQRSDASRIARAVEQSADVVAAVRLRGYLSEGVDLLKLDIEGAETDVLVDCADLLDRVDRIALEFHSFAMEPQQLHTLLGVLADSGYRVYVRSAGPGWAPQPLVARRSYAGMDMQLLVYAFRT